ncbi:DUF6879 family protein [Acrocarpospora sp. B8E8]|uniref:DUF6879 family protein n=1 Tax=Acrocarpospora sp. B8E8 TaxID=3153572 RepID=UPI00325CF623
MSITDQEFAALLDAIESSAVHLEMRDAYGTETELPHMAKWAAREPDDLEWLEGWCSTLRQHAKAGRSVRRARIVSEPLSDYQRWSHSIAYPMVDAGEDIRWVPRRLVSSVPLPGNDFYLLDGERVIFLHYSGNGLIVDMTLSTDQGDVALCMDAFEAVWKLAIPHREYSPT